MTAPPILALIEQGRQQLFNLYDGPEAGEFLEQRCLGFGRLMHAHCRTP